MNWLVPLADIDFSEDEVSAVTKVLKSRWLTMGSITQAFEQNFAEFIGAKHAIAVSNATVALHLACEALGIGPGDEVIVPSLSFVATSNAVLYTGAEVRFAEVVGPQDLTISPASIQSQITPKTKAIIVMHYGGFPCQMSEIIAIANKHNLAIIEDAAHSPGAKFEGKSLGTWGDTACFSFFSNKNLSTGEGGMLVTDRDDIAEKVRIMRSHGMTSLTWDRHKGHAYSYDVVELGYNYRIDEIRSALGQVQLEKLPLNNNRRRAITENYKRMLAYTPIDIPFQNHQGVSAHHIFPILLPQDFDRKSFIDSMRSSRVQTSIHYPPIHNFQYYKSRYPSTSLPTTEAIAEREVTLPLYPDMTEEMVEIVVSAVKDALEKS